MTGVHKSKILTKHVSCKSKRRFYGRKLFQIKSAIAINVVASVKTIVYVKKIIFWILVHVTCKIKFLYFTCIFINYHCVISNCFYLLLSYKILNKAKTFITISSHK